VYLSPKISEGFLLSKTLEYQLANPWLYQLLVEVVGAELGMGDGFPGGFGAARAVNGKERELRNKREERRIKDSFLIKLSLSLGINLFYHNFF
jgi:hypothetical protein